MISTRPIASADAERVADIIYRSITILNVSDYHPDVISAQSQIFNSDWVRRRMVSQFMLVAELDGTIVGTASFKEGEVKSVYVDPSYAYQGIGRALMDEIEGYAIARGYTMIHLGSSKTALGFYDKLGYTLTETQKFESGGHTVLGYLMEKQLH
ncbi:MAG: GNAT family N-acetyltransferase [Candidatus Kariarchaeaceae archaeon]|jgi:putative acetyltransferase